MTAYVVHAATVGAVGSDRRPGAARVLALVPILVPSADGLESMRPAADAVPHVRLLAVWPHRLTDDGCTTLSGRHV